MDIKYNKLVIVNVQSSFSGRDCPENNFITTAPIDVIKRLDEEIDCSEKIIKELRRLGYMVYEYSYWRDDEGSGSDVDEVFISSVI